jgi:hypothetical protein
VQLTAILISIAMLAPAAAAAADEPVNGPVDFDRDVRPILSDSCFSCHGPDASSRAADLRLDTREGATADRDGGAAVVPGSAEDSELWARIQSEFDFELMPPPESHRARLGPRELDLIRRWIDEGAEWSTHWAFISPVKAAGEAPGHPIDRLLSERLDRDGLALSPGAPTHTLARRLAFDLTGLPPDPEALGALGAEPTDAMWSNYVDQLLASPHFGERMTMWWLDGARYADTDGFQQDAVRTNWPWRDWVTGAFQSGMPFDEFTRLQIAGDLLPDATEEQILATCFQRNHMHNGEGGRNAEESRVDYVRDRTNTIGTVWLGLTLECAQCHDHKFDPISQRDYYSLSAFFDSIDETGSAGGGAAPFLKVRSSLAASHLKLAEEELRQATEDVAALEEAQRPVFKQWMDSTESDRNEPYEAWSTFAPDRVCTAEGSVLHVRADGWIECASPDAVQEDYLIETDGFARSEGPGLARVTGLRVEVERATGPGAGLAFTDDGDFIMSGIKLRVRSQDARTLRNVELVRATASVEGHGVDAQNGRASGLLDDDPRTGWTTRGQSLESSAVVVLEVGEPFDVHPGESLIVEVQHRSTVPKSHVRAFRVLLTGERGAAVRSVDATPRERWSQHIASAAPDAALPQDLQEVLFRQYLEGVAAWQSATRAKARFAAQHAAAARGAGELSVTVLREREKPRVTSILTRGVWDQKGETVTRAFPGSLHAGPDAGPNTDPAWRDPALTRLDLANWIVSPDNPLTARVIVNQIWQQLFGRGLVPTPSDFGLQGSRPRYPEILDWLAVDFVEHGWDLRHLLRTIVSSQTYAQASEASPELLARDPYNDLLARGARFRLPSWMLRDAALAASDQLDARVGGPPMYPHQPPGVWEDVFNGRFRYEPTLGRSRLRRTLYAFWRRNAAPTYLFDMADRRTCSVDLRHTNTPLQALTLLNDATFVEAAEALSAHAAEAFPDRLTERVQAMALAVLQRRLDSDEIAVCLELRSDAITIHGLGAAAADALIASTLMNLDEAITHE